MTNALTEDMVWHNDGHVMMLRLEKSDINIIGVTCPDKDDCKNEDVGCLVTHFLMRFGLECNVGVCEPAAEMPIAWTLLGNPRELDSCQVWVIPTNDEAFAAWILTVGI